MSDTTSQQWLWSAPLPDAISGVIHELRMPVVTMRNALDLTHQFTSCRAYQSHYPILRTHTDCLSAHIDQLFDLRAQFERPAQQGDNIPPYAAAITFVQAIISSLRNDLHGLQPDMQTAHANCYADLETKMQPLFMLAQTNAKGFLEAIQLLLVDGLLQRLRNEERGMQ